MIINTVILSTIFFSDTATSMIYTLSLHDALPISVFITCYEDRQDLKYRLLKIARLKKKQQRLLDRKSTRLNSSHVKISYAVFCLKKKNKLKHEVDDIMQSHVLITNKQRYSITCI